MSGHVRPVEVLDCPTAEEVMAEWTLDHPTPGPIDGGAPKLPPMEHANMVRLTELAREIGRDPSKVRKMATKLGCLVEFCYLMDGHNRRQRTAVTNASGAWALRKWYGVAVKPRVFGTARELDNFDDARQNGWIYSGDAQNAK